LINAQNRINNSYEEYQQILIDRWESTLFWFAKKEKEKYNLYFAKPTPKVPWLPGKPREKYYKRLFGRLSSQLKSGNFHYSFCTLTYHTAKWSQQSSFHLLKSHIKEFIRRLKKRYPGIQYFWVIELTKRLYPHIHIIFNQFVHWTVIRAIWYKVTKSYITDIRAIPSGNIASYIASYLSSQKKSNESQWGTIFKNVSRLIGNSRHFFAEKVVSEEEQIWFLISLSTNLFTEDWRLNRKDKDKDFWLIPHHYAAGLLIFHYVDHTNWEDTYQDIYYSFTKDYSVADLEMYNSMFRFHVQDVHDKVEIPF